MSTDVPDERFFVGVLVVNGTPTGQRLAPLVDRIRDVGYSDVRGVVGAVQVLETTIYYAGDARAEAGVVAADLGYEPGSVNVAPVEEAPPVAGLGTARVMVYLGRDLVPEPPSPEPPPDEQPPPEGSPPSEAPGDG